MFPKKIDNVRNYHNNFNEQSLRSNKSTFQLGINNKIENRRTKTNTLYERLYSNSKEKKDQNEVSLKKVDKLLNSEKSNKLLRSETFRDNIKFKNLNSKKINMKQTAEAYNINNNNINLEKRERSTSRSKITKNKNVFITNDLIKYINTDNK